MEEQEEEIDIMEFLASKGVGLDPFKHELLELQKVLEHTNASNIGKERDVDTHATELRMLREQLLFARRNVDELVSQQEVLKETIDNAHSKKEGLIDREQQNRQEISAYHGYAADLKEALSVGADWTHEQIDQRVTLEKERDFIASRLENQNNQLGALRAGIENMYSTVESVSLWSTFCCSITDMFSLAVVRELDGRRFARD
jgi:chromosome segregation ATPase